MDVSTWRGPDSCTTGNVDKTVIKTAMEYITIDKDGILISAIDGTNPLLITSSTRQYDSYVRLLVKAIKTEEQK